LSAKSQGYLTCVCTNNNNIRLSALEDKFHFFQDFDAVVSSHMVGECKPSTAIYQELLDKLDIEPHELVYADDNPDRIQGALDLGITAFVFTDFDQFLQELEKLGINLQ
jgi:putative hydrolase of the HAD superfamily